MELRTAAMKKKLLLSMMMILSILLLSSCTTTLFEIATGKTNTQEKKNAKNKKDVFYWAEEDLGEQLYSVLKGYNSDSETKVSVSDGFTFSRSTSGYWYSGEAVMSFTLDAVNAGGGVPELSIEYTYSEYSRDYYSASNTSFYHAGIDDSPSYILLTCDGMTDYAYINLYNQDTATYSSPIGGNDAERFIMSCPSSRKIRIEVYGANGDRVNAVFYNGNSRRNNSEYYHTFKADDLQNLIKAYNILRAYGKDKSVSTMENTGFTVRDYVTPEIWADDSVTTVVLKGDSFYLRYKTLEENRRYGLNGEPTYLLLRVPGKEESLLISVDLSGSYRMDNELISFITQYSDSDVIEVTYYNKNWNRLVLYYRNSDGGRSDMYMTGTISVKDMKKLLNLYYSIYGRDVLEGYEDLTYMGWGNACVYSSPSNPVMWRDGEMVLKYHTYVQNSVTGLHTTPYYLLLSRSDGKRMMIGVDKTGILGLSNDALKFLYESPAGSSIELTYYNSTKNQINWYYYDKDYSRQSVAHKDIISADGTRRLIMLYSALMNDPLDSWEFNMEGALNYILRLDGE